LLYIDLFQECQKRNFSGQIPLTHSSRTSRKRKPNPFLQSVYYIFITETNSNLYTSENYKFIQYPLPFFTISILFHHYKPIFNLPHATIPEY
ncbi:hypothetical protein MG3_05764, partial [Candida albicans P78048]